MTRPVTLSLAQIDVSFGQPEANLATAESLAAEARRRGSDVIVFPELWTTAYDLAQASRHAAVLGGGIFARLSDLARRHSLYVTGSVLRRDGEAFYNCAPLFSPQGELLGHYDKVHLFGLMEEDRYLTAGNRTPVFDLPWGRCAIGICYDLRFPELFRKYALLGAEMIFLPSEWPYPRLAHWQTLLRARAIENQSFYVACNRVGRTGETHFFGHSSVIDPAGQAIVEAEESEELLTVSVDMDQIAEVRKVLTVFKDRRPEVYVE